VQSRPISNSQSWTKKGTGIQSAKNSKTKARRNTSFSPRKLNLLAKGALKLDTPFVLRLGLAPGDAQEQYAAQGTHEEKGKQIR